MDTNDNYRSQMTGTSRTAAAAFGMSRSIESNEDLPPMRYVCWSEESDRHRSCAYCTVQKFQRVECFKSYFQMNSSSNGSSKSVIDGQRLTLQLLFYLCYYTSGAAGAIDKKSGRNLLKYRVLVQIDCPIHYRKTHWKRAYHVGPLSVCCLKS